MSTSGGLITAASAPSLVDTGAVQTFSEVAKQIGLTNLGTVRWVEPEQFASVANNTDDKQFGAACAAMALVGGMVRLRPGKTYVWTAPPATVDFSVSKKQLVIQAWGSVITANYAGAAWTCQGNTGNGGDPNTLVWLGGEIDNSIGDGITLNDVGKAYLYRMAANCPLGSGWVSNNVTGFSENNHYIELYDMTCTHGITFANLGSPSSSFARTVIRSLRTQGGVAGQAKVNIGDNTALYGALIDGISGNLVTGAIAMRIAGNMHGAIIQGNFHCEVSTGPGPAYYFTVGALTGGQRATLIAPMNINGTMAVMDPGSAQPDLYGALYPGWGCVTGDAAGAVAVGTETPFTLPNASGPIALTPLNTEITIFTLTLAPGEYDFGCAMEVQQPTASTVTNYQARFNGGTATYTVAGQQSDMTATPSIASATQQTSTLRLRSKIVVTVAGTVIITARASQVAQVNSTTAASGFGGCTGYSLLRVA